MWAFRVESSDGRADDFQARCLEHRIEGAAELRIAVMDQELCWPAAILKVHDQIARLLGHPGSVGVPRHCYVLDLAAAEADEHEHIQPPQQDRVDREEVAGEHARGVGAKEGAPSQMVPLRRWRHARGPEHAPYQARRDLDPELAQLANDARVTSGRVLAGQPHDQLSHLAP